MYSECLFQVRSGMVLRLYLQVSFYEFEEYKSLPQHVSTLTVLLRSIFRMPFNESGTHPILFHRRASVLL
ncbi:hypothetical protein E2C01_043673 [Portunus trituberculatus]|uniref:Uncharacterized protein n=1 Tax=Portunus trituberculatus TaxID=210409 RepID=A0A5B7FY75_PORTR|nr:hypothetical protein [Portunus trituberculatus]